MDRVDVSYELCLPEGINECYQEAYSLLSGRKDNIKSEPIEDNNAEPKKKIGKVCGPQKNITKKVKHVADQSLSLWKYVCDKHMQAVQKQDEAKNVESARMDGFLFLFTRYTIGSIFCECVYVAAKIVYVSVVSSNIPNHICCQIAFKPMGNKGFVQRFSNLQPCEDIAYVLRHEKMKESDQTIIREVNVHKDKWISWQHHIPFFFYKLSNKTVFQVAAEMPEIFSSKPVN